NTVAIELSVFAGQRLDRRIADIKTMRKEVRAWETDRNALDPDITWLLATEAAQVKLSRLY
ncbi:MAG: IS630 family transposase, partial [Deltaproteobacteria bacterium]|nr:IS630 family transposase [Deltaproteobacteria bacterium]